MYSIIKKIRSPSEKRKPEFDNGNSISKGKVEWLCSNCVKTNEIELRGVLDNYIFGKEPPLKIEVLSFAESAFGVKLYKLALCGGWSHFISRSCNSCPTEFLIWIGMNEVSNSHYKLTCHAIYEYSDVLVPDVIEKSPQKRKWWRFWE